MLMLGCFLNISGNEKRPVANSSLMRLSYFFHRHLTLITRGKVLPRFHCCGLNSHANTEEQAIATTYKHTLPFWLRYVEDTVTAVLHADQIK